MITLITYVMNLVGVSSEHKSMELQNLMHCIKFPAVTLMHYYTLIFKISCNNFIFHDSELVNSC